MFVMRKIMTSNEQKLRRLISNEIKTIIKESVRPRRTLASLIFEEDEKKPADKEKSGDKPAGKYTSFDEKTNIKGVDASEIYKQLVSRDLSAPVFDAMKKGAGVTVDPELCADHYEKMGEETFVSRVTALQAKIPATGLPKDQMPFLPGPQDANKATTVDDLEDALNPGGKYNVDVESTQRIGASLSEAVVYRRWGKLAGILTEKLDPPAPNALKGGDEESEKYLKSGLEDGNEKDDNVPYEKPGSVKASAAIPTQSNILIGKTLGFAVPKDAGVRGVAGGDLGAYASTENEILDGHHRWAATMISSPDASMGTFMNINLKIVGGGDKVKGLQQLTAIGNALGNATKTK